MPHPVLNANALLHWYDTHARALPWRVGPLARARGERAEPYAVWLSEIMLQQTTVPAVGRYYLDFRHRWPTVTDLAAAPLEEVLSAWAGLGYYARARNLHACARAVAEMGGQFPRTSEDLLALPGIGPYTAAAMAAICFDERVPVIDGNVERVMARLMRLPNPVRDEKPAIRAALVPVVPARAGDFAQAMMDLGATVCAPRNAACLTCPLQPDCAAARTGDALAFPVKPAKKPRPVRFGTAFVLTNEQGDVWLRRRPPKGLLAQMHEVPGSDWTDSPADPAPPQGLAWRPAGQVVHVFTHFELRLDVLASEGPPPADWSGGFTPREALPDAALPSLFVKVLAAAGIGLLRRKKENRRRTGGE